MWTIELVGSCVESFKRFLVVILGLLLLILQLDFLLILVILLFKRIIVLVRALRIKLGQLIVAVIVRLVCWNTA